MPKTRVKPTVDSLVGEADSVKRGAPELSEAESIDAFKALLIMVNDVAEALPSGTGPEDDLTAVLLLWVAARFVAMSEPVKFKDLRSFEDGITVILRETDPKVGESISSLVNAMDLKVRMAKGPPPTAAGTKQ